MTRLWSLGRRFWFDGLLLAGTGVSLAVVVAGQHTKDGPEGPLWFDVLASLAIFLPLFARRLFPFGAPVAVAIAVASSSFVDAKLVPYDFFVFLIGCAAVFLVGSLPDRSQAVTGLALAVGAGSLVAYNNPKGKVGDLIPLLVIFGVVWTIALGVSRKVGEAAEVSERARLAVAEERARIARELHDILAHSVSVMVVQAEAAEEMLDRNLPERAREPLSKIQETGRGALADMRRMLGILRRHDAQPALVPQPGIANLELLLAKVRESGLPVELVVEGEPSTLPPGIDLSAFRIVQEALTNSLKYAGPARARVVVRYAPEALELEVSDDGAGSANGAHGGHGLVGMRERVALFGGELHAGPAPDRGYVVRARLPLEAAP